MNTNMTAFNQWATRPADQRFESLEALQSKLDNRRIRSRGVQLKMERIHALDTEQGIRINGGIEAADPSHWSFGQLCGWAGAPAGFLRDKLSDKPGLMVETLNHCISKSPADELKWLLIEPETDNETPVLQAVTSPTYGRIWDADVVACASRLRDRSNGKWHNPLAWAPGHFGDASKAIPSGLYASDRDVFLFMIDGGSFLEGGDGKSLNRGFIVTNSEVGSRTFTLTTFLFRGCCGNHIIWGQQDVTNLVIRHTKGGPARFDQEALPALISYAESSHNEEESVFRKAGDMLLPEKRDELDSFIGKAGAKFSKRELDYAFQAAKLEEGDCRTLWQLVQGLTAHARTFEFVDARVDLETRAGKLLNLAK